MPSELMHQKVFMQGKASGPSAPALSLGECILASGLVKSTCGSCSWSHKAAFTSQMDSLCSFLPESNPGDRWGAGCLPKEKCLRKRHGESGCVISNSACMHTKHA